MRCESRHTHLTHIVVLQCCSSAPDDTHKSHHTHVTLTTHSTRVCVTGMSQVSRHRCDMNESSHTYACLSHVTPTHDARYSYICPYDAHYFYTCLCLSSRVTHMTHNTCVTRVINE